MKLSSKFRLYVCSLVLLLTLCIFYCVLYKLNPMPSIADFSYGDNSIIVESTSLPYLSEHTTTATTSPVMSTTSSYFSVSDISTFPSTMSATTDRVLVTTFDTSSTYLTCTSSTTHTRTTLTTTKISTTSTTIVSTTKEASRSTSTQTTVNSSPNSICLPYMYCPIQYNVAPATNANIDNYDIVLDDGSLFSTPTNHFFFGHNYNSFSGLSTVKVGEEIIVWTDSVPKTYTVIVSSAGRLNSSKNDIILDDCDLWGTGSSSLYRSTGYDTIRLITCYSIFIPDSRWLVVACDLSNPLT